MEPKVILDRWLDAHDDGAVRGSLALRQQFVRRSEVRVLSGMPDDVVQDALTEHRLLADILAAASDALDAKRLAAREAAAATADPSVRRRKAPAVPRSLPIGEAPTPARRGAPF